MRIALRNAGPAILASGLTVMAALLVLMLADVNSTAGLGPIGALGVGLAMIFMLTMLPAALTIFGRRAFWPFIPYGPSGARRTADRRPARALLAPDRRDARHVAAGRRVGRAAAAARRGGTIAVLLVLCLGLIQLDTGLTNGNSFRGEVEAVKGNELLAAPLPGRRERPDHGDRAATAATSRRSRTRCKQDPAVARRAAGRSEGPPGTQLTVAAQGRPVLDRGVRPDPAAARRRQAGRRRGRAGRRPDRAESYDLRTSAARDNRVIIPIALVVVLPDPRLPAARARRPAMLVATNILSFAAALGLGIFFFQNVFGFPGEDPSLPLLSFVFLVALGIDYNIFLMARVREETLRHGTREGMLRGLAVTGAVITVGGHRARRHVLRARGAAARLPDRDRVRDRGRRAARHVRRALDRRARADVRHRRADLVAVEPRARRGRRLLRDRPAPEPGEPCTRPRAGGPADQRA